MPGKTETHPERVSISDHDLIQCIGRGSYGEVWLARNLMGLYRAVKVVYRKKFEHERPFERELAGIRKFEPISRSHEGFVDVLHVGHNEKEGHFYYIMELGDDLKTGQTIDPDFYVPKTLAREVALRGRLPLEECLQLGLSLSKALDYLHKQDLVHRDIKPSNIIFVHGVPKLADIGLVADIKEARSYVGTEGFIPPEGPGTPQADVYSLGKVLYEISTGKDRHDFPELPTRLDDTADLDRFVELNEVILRACKSDVVKRYQSAEDMHTDLVVLTSGRSVKRLRLLEERLATIRKAAGITAIVVVVFGIILFQLYREWNFVRAGRQRQIGGKVAYGTGAMEKGDLLESLPSFAEALHLDRGDPNRERTHRVRLRAVLEQIPKLTQLWFDDHRIDEAWFSPDGHHVLLVQHWGKARIFDVQTGKPVSPSFGQSQGLVRAAFHPSGQRVLTASYDGTACVWNPASGERVMTLKHPDRVFSAAFGPNGSQIVTACKDGTARVWNSGTGKQELELKRHTDALLFAAFSRDGRFIVTTSRDNSAQIWRADSGKTVGPPLEHSSWVSYASFSPDSSKVVTAGLDHKTRVWEAESGRRILPDLTHSEGVTSAEFSPDGLLILTAGLDGAARLWDAPAMQPVQLNPVLKHGSRLRHASFAGDGHRIVTACQDGSVRIWDLAGNRVSPIQFTGSLSENGNRFLTLSNGGFQVLDTLSMESTFVSTQQSVGLLEADLSADGKFILTFRASNADTNQRVLEVRDGSAGVGISPPITVTNTLAQIAISDNGQLLALFAGTGAQILSVLTGGQVGHLLAHGQPVSGAVFSPDARWLVTWEGAFAHLWDPTTGRPAFAPLRHSLPVNLARFSPDGRHLLTGTSDDQFNPCECRIWDVLTGRPVGRPMLHSDGILCATFSLDGSKVVTGSEDYTAIVWDAVTGSPITPPLRHSDQVHGVAFSPNGLWVATATADGLARIWDTGTGEPLTPPLKHDRGLRSTAFSADNDRLGTANKMGLGWFWDLRPDQRPLADLLLLSRLLTGFQSTSSDVHVPQSKPERQAAWQKLRSDYPGDFKTSQGEILAWHSQLADHSHSERHWSAAVFHLKQLLALSPNDSVLSDQLKQAQGHLSSQQRR